LSLGRHHYSTQIFASVKTLKIRVLKKINSLDEVTHAFSLCPVPSEAKLLCGLKSQVREFDLNLPGQTIFYVFYLDNVRNLFPM
jgi:hypothetical protein